MSSRELNRVEVMGRVKAGSLSLAEAAELMSVSYRQAKRMLARFRRGGAKALQHGGCGRQSMCEQLGIRIIAASSPQAKGRVAHWLLPALPQPAP